MESPVAPNREIQLKTEVVQRRDAEVYADSPAIALAWSRSHSCDPGQASPNLDTLLSDSAESLREQVRQVYQRLDEVQKEVLKSKGEDGESSKCGSPFTPENFVLKFVPEFILSAKSQRFVPEFALSAKS
ncbi:hypothetical protein BHE74_00004084 [Ensete ventricosum]|nr:hypothetical protein BHE74_00004084 [Ensete ventricosum]